MAQDQGKAVNRAQGVGVVACRSVASVGRNVGRVRSVGMCARKCKKIFEKKLAICFSFRYTREALNFAGLARYHMARSLSRLFTVFVCLFFARKFLKKNLQILARCRKVFRKMNFEMLFNSLFYAWALMFGAGVLALLFSEKMALRLFFASHFFALAWVASFLIAPFFVN